MVVHVPICVYTSSVNAPINCGVALRSSARRVSSTNWPIEYQRADLRRCCGVVSVEAHNKAQTAYFLALSSFAIG